MIQDPVGKVIRTELSLFRIQYSGSGSKLGLFVVATDTGTNHFSLNVPASLAARDAEYFSFKNHTK